MNKERFWQLFPLGSHLCREPMPPMGELKRDMEILKNKGFNLIKLQENWMLDEPAEGVYKFEKYHELIAHAGRLDMGVYLGLTCEQAPNWLWEKHPGCRMEHKDGTMATYQAQSTLPADGKPGPCYDDPGAMADQLRFIKKLVAELGEHENIVVWNTWQEIGYWADWLSGGPVCYCPNTIAFYRRWLESVYGSIDALNEHWNVRYGSFGSIVPDRGVRGGPLPQVYYFKYFMDNVQTANVLARRCETIKEADAFGRPVFAHKGAPELGSGMDWTYARTQDFIGISNYPAWGCGHAWDDFRQAGRLPRHEALLTEMWDGLSYKMDFIRSASRAGAPVWAAEYQGGPVSTDYHVGRVPDAADMRRWMLTTMSAGATAISFWITRAEIMAPETNGFALLDSVGETTERLEEASRVGRALAGRPDLFAANNRPQADAAILVNEWNYQLLRCMNFAPGAYLYDMRGWYKTMWSAGISCDFVEASQLDEPRIGNYKAIVAPFALSMSDGVARALLRYAEGGGNLILEGGCGRLNETAYAVRGQMNGYLREALNVGVTRHALVREPSGGAEADDAGKSGTGGAGAGDAGAGGAGGAGSGDAGAGGAAGAGFQAAGGMSNGSVADRWSQPERTWGEYEEAGYLEGSGALENARLRASVFVETYQADDADVCFRWGGRPAGVRRRAGGGRIWLIGTALGPSATAYADEDSKKAAAGILGLCGVRPAHPGRLLVQKRAGDAREAWFITNPYKEAVTEAVALPEGATAQDLLGGPLDIGAGAVTLTVAPLDVRVIIVG